MHNFYGIYKQPYRLYISILENSYKESTG